MKFIPFTSYEITAEFIYTRIDSRAVLYLSGGNTPKPLYELISHDRALQAGAVGMVDERFGPRWHENSNEKMMKETGLLEYLEQREIPFHPILTGKNREETTQAYDKTLRTLHAQYPRHVALLGIGADGHIAGLKGQNSKGKIHNSQLNSSSQLVISYNDIGGMGERITQTFLALSMMDEIVVLVLGDEKKKALELMKTEGSEEEIPARFLMRDTIAEKVTIITDQTV
jgi:6-phosphogluconolactonase/glucosamine-6-phosphate isomerase/deaminase